MRRPIRLIRNILLLLIAAIVILAGVLLFNVFSHGSRQIQVAAVPRAAVDAQGAAARLAEAIRFQTISNFLNPDQAPMRCAACRRISKKAFRRFMPRRNASSSATTACSTPGRAPIPRRRRSRCWRIRTWCRSRRAPRRTGSSRRSTASSPMASSGAAARGTTRATSIRCWKPPSRWRRRASARNERSISPSAMTRKSAAPAAQRRSRRCWPRAASGSTSCSTRAC